MSSEQSSEGSWHQFLKEYRQFQQLSTRSAFEFGISAEQFKDLAELHRDVVLQIFKHNIELCAELRAIQIANMRQGLARGANRGIGNNQQKGNGSANSSPTTPGPSTPTFPNPLTTMYPPLQSAGTPENLAMDAQMEPEQTKFFFREEYAKLGVKGNFMPLAAQPKIVDLGEWLAHQAVEQFKLLEVVLSCIQEPDSETKIPLCNPKSCPIMSAGRSHIYTWLNSNREPVKVTAPQYISMVQRWINGKTKDNKIFPAEPLTAMPSTYASGGFDTPNANVPIAMGPTTSNASLSTLSGRDWIGKSGGFPESFLNDCKTIFRQMFRLYAHVYHSHWDLFYNVTGTNPTSSGWTDLNSCFVHFITVSKLYGLLSDRDLEPMHPLVNTWIGNGAIPPDAAAGACTITQPQ